ncbi:MAG: hypothetical protein WCK03_02270 [Candidatus Taylorbacteria bacterium]
MDQDQLQPKPQDDQLPEEVSVPSPEQTVPTKSTETQNTGTATQPASTEQTVDVMPPTFTEPKNSEPAVQWTPAEQSKPVIDSTLQPDSRSASEETQSIVGAATEVISLAEKIVPAGTTQDQMALFQSWLTKYLKSMRVLGTLGLKKKRRRHMDKVVELLGKHGPLTQIELGHIMRMNTVSIGQYVHDLIAEGRVRHVGAMHHGRYEKI